MGLTGGSNGAPFVTGCCKTLKKGGTGVSSRGSTVRVTSRLGATSCVTRSIRVDRGLGDPTPPFAADALRRRTSEGLNFAAGHAVLTTRRLCRNITVENINSMNLVACVEASSLEVSTSTRGRYEDCVNSTCKDRCLPGAPEFCGAGGSTRSTRRTVHPASVRFGPRDVGSSLGPSVCGLCGLV